MKFLYGPEKFLVYQKLIDFKKDFMIENPQAEIVDFDLEEVDLKDIEEKFLQSKGLFCAKELIIFRNSLSLAKSEQEWFKEFLQKKQVCQSEMAEVIFVEISENSKKNINTKLGRYLKSKGEKVEFKKLTDDQLRQWLNSEFLKRSEKKVSIEMMAIRELISISRRNLWQLTNEIDKLINYVEQGEVKLRDVRNLCSGIVEAKIFDLVDAIGNNNKRRALLLKQQLIDQGENEFYIFTMIIFQIRNLVKVSECLRKGFRDPRLIKEKIGLHPFVIQKTIGNLNKFSFQKIKYIYKMIADLDQKVKIGKIEIKSALEWLIVNI